MPLESQAWHANAQPLIGRATWYRRRGTPAIIPHLGMPLESQLWHAIIIIQQEEDWARHLSFYAWHAKTRRPWVCHLSSGRGTPTKKPSTYKGRGRLDPGRATLVQLSREETKHIEGVWHTRPWACHASSTFERGKWCTHNGRGTPDPGHATLV
ncbi:hypothetical protein AHAS_Ahas16G0180900 [Arachis hypogaea]